jgi:hypothetical protein
MRKIVLLAHNGVFGSNPVAPYAGDEIEAGHFILEDARIDYEHDGRTFSLAYAENVGQEDETIFLREKVQGEPSDWAKAKEVERSLRILNTVDPRMAGAE